SHFPVYWEIVNMLSPYRRKLFFCLFACTIAALTQAQDSTHTAHFEGLSLKDLLETKIVSASKKSERLFEAPLSASVLKSEDIQRVGCTSIMEALRLIPGLKVREQ
ncbi:MAG: hypothetical protein H7Y27_13955, partial [Gemmatimonadaceae bacterium]|nr:hypothetical protein [Chitinophagaceae bacterium]